jgi:GTP-binding protein
VLCDIPGLIEGASEGVGCGIDFLQHIERCKIIAHLVDVSAEDPYQNYLTVLNEMSLYNKTILEKKQIVVLNKIDKISKRMVDNLIKKISKSFDGLIFPISIHNQVGLVEVLSEIEKQVELGRVEEARLRDQTAQENGAEQSDIEN